MPLVLLIVFIVVPIIELAVIIQVGQALGLLPTVLLLIADSVIGTWLVRREGLKAWQRFRAALDQARIPAAEVVDGALVMLGGALMLTPGFVTDIFGLLLVIPPSRALVNRMIRTRVRWRFGIPGMAPRHTTPSPDTPIEVEVLDVERTQPRD
ncbi:MAG: FxsA family protein [Pseudonocardiaceae bacterium]